MMRTIVYFLVLLLAYQLFSVALANETKAVNIQKNWYFKVYLDDSPIGYHHYNLKRSGDIYQLSSKAEFDVKFLYLSVYNYLHNNSETWRGKCLTSLTSNTDDNGKNLFVKLHKKNNQQTIETQNGVQSIKQCLRSFAYWNPELLDAKRLINSQTGDLVDINFTRDGNETITINQKKIKAKRYRIKGKDIDISLWYSQGKEWLALETETKNGYVLRYELDKQLLKSQTAQRNFHL